MATTSALSTHPLPDAQSPYSVFRKSPGRGIDSIRQGINASESLRPEAGLIVLVPQIPNSKVLVKRPFAIRIDLMDERFLATSPISEIYELGETGAEALRNYLDTLVDHFYWLREKEAVLAPSVKEEFVLLCRYLQASL